jgi:hydrogenase maturation protease
VARTLILGLGNPLLTDDGVGVHVVERLRAQGLPPGVEVEDGGTGGLLILDLVAGFDRLVVVDAIDVGEPPGTLLELDREDLERLACYHTVSPHDADLLTALRLGRELGLALPTELFCVAVQVADITTLAEECTPAVRAAIPGACTAALRLAQLTAES